MATIINSSTEETVILRSQHVFGRHPATAHTLLSDQASSRIHATVHWEGGDWQLRDSSSNGTFLNSQQLTPGQKYPLTISDRIQFSGPQACVWQVVDLEPPKSMLFRLGEHSHCIELDDLTVLPDASQPEISIYRNNQAQWVMENQHEHMFLESGDRITVDDHQWVFISPDDIDETKPAQVGQDSAPELRFTVSRDEEHIDLNIAWNQQNIDLGERVHHYLLLCLARKRLSDQKAGMHNQDQGWLEKELLVRMTGMDEKHINIQIYRFRKQLLLIQNANNLLSLIERRRGQLRLATDSINIRGGQQII